MKITELTLDDLKTVPIWIVVEREPVNTIMPTGLSRFPTDNMEPNPTGEYLVFTMFVTSGGQRFFGFCFPWDSSGIDYTHPTIITTKGQLDLSKALLPTEIESALALPSGDIFPLKIETMVPAADGTSYCETID